MEILKEKVAIITGASSGIGRATAIHFSNLGAKLVLVARNEANLDETITHCKKNQTVKVIGDINEKETHQKIIEKSLEAFGKIDILVNNAGIGKPDPLENMKEEDYDKIMNTNLKSPIFLTKACLPHLISQKGAIVNVSSVLGTKSSSTTLAYCISKSGLDQFTKCLALDLAPKGVRVNSVNPGAVVTNILIASGLAKDVQERDKFWENEIKYHPMNRVAQPEEVATLIGFLASEQSGFITGELVHIDGGRHINKDLFSK